MATRSLSTRIIIFSGIWVIIALIVVALLLVYFYIDHAAQHYDEHVSMHLEEMVEASVFSPNGTFELTSDPSDPRYHNLHSGWYWAVKQSGELLKQSFSLGEYDLQMDGIEPTGSVVVHEVVGPNHEKLRMHVIEIELDPAFEPIVYYSSAPTTGYTDDVLNYSNHISGSFVLLAIGLLMAVVAQVRFALKPLNAIEAEIGDIREGRATKLSRDYPNDVQPLVDELNNLIDHNAVLLKRARNQLGDLAHAVKNPLTVINNEARNMQADQREMITKQTSDISKNIDHYLSRARTFGTESTLGSRSNVKTVVDDLVYAMQRLYQQRELKYDTSRLKGCSFRGEGQDLEEMVGNLMDNACKWTQSQVVVSCETGDERLLLVVEDDGPGIPKEEVVNVMRRGHKLDESVPGHGQGLGIVSDIADLYGGSLNLVKSPLGGLRAELDLPAA